MTDHPVSLTVNGRVVSAAVDPRTPLDDLLRSAAGCTSVHVGCEEGTCGACTVLLDGRPVRSCTVLAVQAAGRDVTTLEGSSGRGAVGRLQAAFLAAGAVQCGFCTPGMLLNAGAVVTAAGDGGAGLADRALAGQLCRCTGYEAPRRAVAAVAAGREVPGGPGRLEDDRLLRGGHRYVADVDLPGALWATVVRSTEPHAGVVAVDGRAAAAVPGVVAVVTAGDLPATALWREGAPASGERYADEPVLAGRAVRYVGQPVAMVVAESQAAAEDGARAVSVQYGPPPAGPPPGPELVWRQQVGDADAALARADVVVRATLRVQRHTAVPLETRGLAAAWDPAAGRLTVWGAAKHPHANRDHVAGFLGLPADRVRMAPTDVGGGFGVRGEVHPEDLLVPWAAMTLGRPVRWQESRPEHLVAANHSRGQVWEVAVGAMADGTLAGATVTVRSDVGAYRRPLSDLHGVLASAMFPGPYKLPAYAADVWSCPSFATPVGTYRAPGRFEAGFVRERAVELVAAELGLPADAVRRRNLVRPADLPWDVGTVNEGAVVYTGIDLPAAMDRVEAVLSARPPAVPAPGCRAGRVVVPFVDKAGLGPFETAAVTVSRHGIAVAAGASPAGQGHETALSTVCAEVLGVDRGDVSVTCGDTDQLSRGRGSFASRTAVMAGNAVAVAAAAVRDRLLDLAAARLGAPRERLRLAGGAVEDRGGPGRVPLAELSAAAAGGVVTAEAEFRSDDHTYPAGAVGVEVEVDPELLTVRVRRLVVACDVGRALDEGVVRGQLAGAAVAGLGGALWEELAHDPDGRPLTTDLAGYGLPAAADVPPVEVELLDRGPDPGNPLGVKGVGEAGIVAIGGAVACAVGAALPELRSHLDELPLDPSRLLAAAERASGHEHDPADHTA